MLENFRLKQEDLPVIYLVSNDEEGFLRYTGAIVDTSLSEWILRNTAPPMGELTLASPSGSQYATQFFSSRKLKFILILPSQLFDREVHQIWNDLSDQYHGKAIFSYMIQSSVADVLEFFKINSDSDLPLIVGHAPTTESRYKSNKLINVKDPDELSSFINGVISGNIGKMIKSESVPTAPFKQGTVLKVVGSNVLETVKREDVDVFLIVYTPFCYQCKQLLPLYDIFAKAMQGEPRIVVAKIDAQANDIPAVWGVKNYPTLLWFPAKDKPYKSFNAIMPKSYWDAGFTIQELVSMVQREGSFDPKTLRIATSEQLGTLMGDEEIYRSKYEEEERYYRRNDGRIKYDHESLDWLLGEVTFDGKRWHIVALVGISLFLVISVAVNVLLCSSEKRAAARRLKTKNT